MGLRHYIGPSVGFYCMVVVVTLGVVWSSLFNKFIEGHFYIVKCIVEFILSDFSCSGKIKNNILAHVPKFSTL